MMLAYKSLFRFFILSTFICLASVTFAQTQNRLDPNLADILFLHNTYRVRHQAPKLTWSPSLAAEARRRANRCDFRHYGADSLGLVSTRLKTLRKAGAYVTNLWYKEAYGYNYKAGFQRARGHFSQMVWKSTRSIGCAVVNCARVRSYVSANYVVCIYDPPGNIKSRMLQNVNRPKL